MQKGSGNKKLDCAQSHPDELANGVFSPWPIFPGVAGPDAEPDLEKRLFKLQALFQAVGCHLWVGTLSLSVSCKSLHLQRGYNAGYKQLLPHCGIQAWAKKLAALSSSPTN